MTTYDPTNTPYLDRKKAFNLECRDLAQIKIGIGRRVIRIAERQPLFSSPVALAGPRAGTGGLIQSNTCIDRCTVERQNTFRNAGMVCCIWVRRRMVVVLYVPPRQLWQQSVHYSTGTQRMRM